MMTRRFQSLLLLALGTTLICGCPIYNDDYERDSACYGECPRPGYPKPWCEVPSDCAPGTNCGVDHACHPGDCTTSGCPSGYVCRGGSDAYGLAACVPFGSTLDAGDNSDTGNDSGDSANVGKKSTCKSDKDCASPAGSKCLTDSCVAPQDQCADATQCAAGSQCVDGACTPSCNANTPCPTGYSCDAKGVCTGNTRACTTSADCKGNTTCVQQHCVAPCGAGGTCATGLTCVDGGCTPEEKPLFTCGTDGVQDSCQTGSICLRHSCYIACSADAGANACKAADNFNQCKSVTTTSGTHSVCGSMTNLGTECDPTQSKPCSGGRVCIDGYCN